MSNTAASTTSTLRRRGAAKQATTCREDQERLRSYQSGGPLGHLMYARKGNLAKLNYMDINHLLDRHIAQNKRDTLTSGEVKLLVQEIHDCCQKDELQQGTVDAEMSAMQ
jgi:hypothetical protein